MLWQGPDASFEPLAAWLLESFAEPALPRPFEKHLARLLKGTRRLDLLMHWPVQIRETHRPLSLAHATPGRHVLLALRIVRSLPGTPFRILASDGTGFVHLVFFHGRPAFWHRLFRENQSCVVEGWLDFFRGTLQISHPVLVRQGPPSFAPGETRLEPVYPLAHGVGEQELRALIRKTVHQMPDGFFVPDPFASAPSEATRSWKNVFEHVHAPRSHDDLHATSPERLFLLRQKALAQQIRLLKLRQNNKTVQPFPLVHDPVCRLQCLSSLPFQLTGAQHKALHEIDQDMARPVRMTRLVQGDVGSGKTVLAFLAAAQVVQQGFQSVVLAPSEILARQHFHSFSSWMAPLELPVFLLIRDMPAEQKKKAKAALAGGQPCLVAGTHALLESSTLFPKVALFVVDEQQRFGVQQRSSLLARQPRAHFLMLSATPVPRTLHMATASDLDLSVLRSKPPGRKPVITRVLNFEKMLLLYDRLKKWISTGQQIYWVCPLIENATKSDSITTCEERFSDLDTRFPGKVGVLHSRSVSKERVLKEFSEGTLRILVSTTTIEVGVDVPDASIMVIEHADRFGLAQLHQLRGRIGRGHRESLCILLCHAPGPAASQRLSVVRHSDDGFEIAEQDLVLRGPGEFFGVRQSGTAFWPFLLSEKDLLQIEKTARHLQAHHLSSVTTFQKLWQEEQEGSAPCFT